MIDEIDQVASARSVLAAIDARIHGSISSRQVARGLLKAQSDLVEKMVEEGLLSRSDAAAFLATVSADSLRIEKREGSASGVSDVDRSGPSPTVDILNPVSGIQESSCGEAVEGKRKLIFHRGGGERYIALGTQRGDVSE